MKLDDLQPGDLFKVYLDNQGRGGWSEPYLYLYTSGGHALAPGGGQMRIHDWMDLERVDWTADLRRQFSRPLMNLGGVKNA